MLLPSLWVQSALGLGLSPSLSFPLQIRGSLFSHIQSVPPTRPTWSYPWEPLPPPHSPSCSSSYQENDDGSLSSFCSRPKLSCTTKTSRKLSSFFNGIPARDPGLFSSLRFSYKLTLTIERTTITQVAQVKPKSAKNKPKRKEKEEICRGSSHKGEGKRVNWSRSPPNAHPQEAPCQDQCNQLITEQPFLQKVGPQPKISGNEVASRMNDLVWQPEEALPPSSCCVNWGSSFRSTEPSIPHPYTQNNILSPAYLKGVFWRASETLDTLEHYAE